MGPHTCVTRTLPTELFPGSRNDFLKLNLKFLFYVYRCFAYECTLHLCLVPTEARKGHEMPWDWN